MALTITVNRQTRAVRSSPDTPLLYVLRDELALDGPMFGCGLAQCGSCSVLVDGNEIRSCVTAVGTLAGRSITTVEGLAGTQLHPLQQAWIDEQVPQCGYCQSGMLISAASLLAHTPHPTEPQIKAAMNGHLCRCGTQTRIVKAIARAARATA